MRLTFIIFLFMLTSGQTTAEIYKWTDENGKVQFGDRPPANAQAKKVTVKNNSYTSVEVIYNPDWFYKSKKTPGKKQVVMYSAQWCGICKQAKAYFAEKNIAYTEYDIETSDKGRQDFERMGASSVPIIFIGQVRMNGFRKSSFDKIYFSKGKK